MTRGRYKGYKRQPISLLYYLGTSFHVKGRWGFNEQVRSAVNREFAREFNEALQMALATAR
jgi:hypothetical protein